MEWNTIISKEFNSLLHSGNMSDITLIIGKEPDQISFQVHRLILSLFSKIFHNMFYGPKAINNNKVKLPDDPKSFEDLICYIYTGQWIGEGKSIQRVIKVYRLAEKFKIPSLRAMCSEYMIQNISVGSVFEIYEMATELKDHKLRMHYWKFILINASEVLRNENFINVKVSTVMNVVSAPYINIDSEMTLFTVIVRWIQEQCLREGKEVNSSNIRDKLMLFLPEIRFLTMSVEEFTKLPGKLNLLNESEQLSIVQHMHFLKTNLQLVCSNERKTRCGVSRDIHLGCYSDGQRKISIRTSVLIKQRSLPFLCDTYVHGARFYLSDNRDYLSLSTSFTLTIRNITKVTEIKKTVKLSSTNCMDFEIQTDTPCFLEKGEICELLLEGNDEGNFLYICTGDCNLPWFPNAENSFHFHAIYMLGIP